MTLTKTCVLAVSRTYVKLTERSSCIPATSSRPNGGCVVCLLGIPSHWILTIALRNGHTSSYPSRPGIPIFLTHWVELLFGLGFRGSNWIRSFWNPNGFDKTTCASRALSVLPATFVRRCLCVSIRLPNLAWLCLKLLSNPTKTMAMFVLDKRTFSKLFIIWSFSFFLVFANFRIKFNNIFTIFLFSTKFFPWSCPAKIPQHASISFLQLKITIFLTISIDRQSGFCYIVVKQQRTTKWKLSI